MSRRLLPIDCVVTVLLALLLAYPAQAQGDDTEVHCSVTFMAWERNYDANELRISWYADSPAQFTWLELQIMQNGATVPDERNNLSDWRRFPRNDGEAYMGVTNLRTGKIVVRARLVDDQSRPCIDSDNGIILVEEENYWEPAKVNYAVSNFLAEHEKGLISFSLDVMQPKYNVIYRAWIEAEGSTIASTELRVVQETPQRVEVPIAGVNLRKVKEAIPVVLYVSAWYTDNLKEEVIISKEVKIPPTPPVNPFDKIGDAVVAIGNNQTALGGILVVMVALFLVLLYDKRNKAVQEKERRRGPKAPIDDTETHTPSSPTPGPTGFSIRIQQANSSRYENVIHVDTLRCVFGRNQKMEHGEVLRHNGVTFINILHDPYVSRKHFETRKRENTIWLVTQGENGATVNGQAVAKDKQIAIPMDDRSTIEFGQQTRIELQPL